MWPDCPDTGNQICLPPDLKAYCRVPKVYSMAISTADVCVQIRVFSVFPWQWLCETAASSHTTGGCLTVGRRPSSAGVSVVHSQPYFAFLSQNSSFNYNFLLFVLHSAHFHLSTDKTGCSSPPPVPSGKQQEKTNRTWKMQALVVVAFPLLSDFFKVPKLFLITLDWWSGTLKYKEQKCPGTVTRRWAVYKSYLITPQSHLSALKSAVQVCFCGSLCPWLVLRYFITFCIVSLYLMLVLGFLPLFMANWNFGVGGFDWEA